MNFKKINNRNNRKRRRKKKNPKLIYLQGFCWPHIEMHLQNRQWTFLTPKKKEANYILITFKSLSKVVTSKQASLDRNWDGVAWSLFREGHNAFSHSSPFLQEDSCQSICYHDSWLCCFLPQAKWNWLPIVDPARSGMVLDSQGMGLAKLLSASSGVYALFCASWLVGSFFFFCFLFILYFPCLHLD